MKQYVFISNIVDPKLQFNSFNSFIFFLFKSKAIRSLMISTMYSLLEKDFLFKEEIGHIKVQTWLTNIY